MNDGRDEQLYADRSYRPGPPPELREPPARRSRALGVFVATFALAAFAAVVWYAYDQGRQRGSDATAPLIKADPNPTKVRPEQPGGLQVPNQDKLVYEAMRQGMADAPRVERLLPPPERPVDPPPPAPPLPQAAPPQGAPAAPSADATVPSDAGIPPARIDTPAPAPRIPAPDDEPPAPVAEAEPAPAPSAPVPAVPSPAETPAPTPSTGNPTAAAPAAPPAPEKPAPAKPAPAKPAAAPGGFRIQVGALRDQAAAKAEWARLQKRHPDQLAGLEHRIQRIDLGPGKGVFFRIQSSGVSEASAGAICSGLKAKAQPCIVVRP